MVDNSDVLPRQGFSQMARNMRCQLYFPHPTDQVILLRTGILHHINSYMQALGLTPPSDPFTAPKPPPANNLPDQANDNGPLAAANGPGASAKGPMAAAVQSVMADTVALSASADAVGAAQRNLSDGTGTMPDSSRQFDEAGEQLDSTGQLPASGADEAEADGVHSEVAHQAPACQLQAPIPAALLLRLHACYMLHYLW